ncbi:MAG: hypothetical protein CVU39_11915 [Chloroflexi bacterium HGW-Chloroflexi-10]|nr:MAG: hypothetical protein CVU39_11915 [Chloroflexi bacterium HGW-Chloroflexi-10]
MFYFLVGVICVGYLIYCRLKMIETKSLKVSCPFTLLGTMAVSVALYLTDHKLIAWIVLLVGLYLLTLTLIAIRKITMQKLDPVTGSINN